MALCEDHLLWDIVDNCALCRRASRATQIVTPHPSRGCANVSLPRKGA